MRIRTGHVVVALAVLAAVSITGCSDVTPSAIPTAVPVELKSPSVIEAGQSAAPIGPGGGDTGASGDDDDPGPGDPLGGDPVEVPPIDQPTPDQTR